MVEQKISFRGKFKNLSMENRYFVTYTGDSWYAISVRLRASRIRAGLTYLRMAAALGVHRTTVMRWETEQIRTIDKDVVKRWAEICGVSELWIVRGGDSMDYRLDMEASQEASYRAGYRITGDPVKSIMPVPKEIREGRFT